MDKTAGGMEEGFKIEVSDGANSIRKDESERGGERGIEIGF